MSPQAVSPERACRTDAPEHLRRAAPSAAELRTLAGQLAREAEHAASAIEAARSLAALFARWRRREFSPRAEMITHLAESSGVSRELLDESLDALLAPFTSTALDAFATRAGRARLGVGAFVMPANVAGAGLHELVTALVAGAAAIVKVSLREPFFFPTLIATLKEIAPEMGARTAAVSFGRERIDLMEAVLESCDFVVALGEDATIASLTSRTRLFGFGSRASGAFVAREAADHRSAETAAALARDVVLFEQRGCLSPHQVFVESGTDIQTTARFARSLAEALSALAQSLPPAKLPFQAASAIRRMRESARWRGLGGRGVMLWEGPAMAWTVVLDPEARFQLSPGYRTVTVTPVGGLNDLEGRLAPMAGRLEGFAVGAGDALPDAARGLLGRLGVTWISQPGAIQSPPLEWRHGGGAFLDFVCGVTR